MTENIIMTEEVNEQEVKECNNCFDCEFLRLNTQGKMSCNRRENEGVVFEVVDTYIAHLPCPARDVEVWDEEIDEDGEFEVDNELGYGWNEWLKNKGI